MSNGEDAAGAEFRAITEALRSSVTPEGRVKTIQFGEAVKTVAPLYDRVFGAGFVSNHLKSDILGHAGGVVQAAMVNPAEYEFVDQMVPRMLAEKPVEQIRGRWGEGIVELLWTKRCLDYILRFLDYGLFTDTNESLHKCATRAYNEVLKPYHGVMVSSIVSLAFNMAPKRNSFIRALGFDSLEASQNGLRGLLEQGKLIVAHIHSVLSNNGCDFPDRVDSIR